MGNLVLDTENPLATKVQTRSGRPARLLCIDFQGTNKTYIVAAIKDGEWEMVMYFTSEGKYSNTVSSFDLVNAPKKHVFYQNFYKLESGFISGGSTLFDDRQDADNGKTITLYRVACIRIELVEGQFDE